MSMTHRNYTKSTNLTRIIRYQTSRLVSSIKRQHRYPSNGRVHLRLPKLRTVYTPKSSGRFPKSPPNSLKLNFVSPTEFDSNSSVCTLRCNNVTSSGSAETTTPSTMRSFTGHVQEGCLVKLLQRNRYGQARRGIGGEG